MKVLDFYADWCGPCQMIRPILEQVEKEHPEVEFASINIDEDQVIAEQYGVMSIPTLVILDGDKVKETLVGVKTKEEIEKVIGD